MTQHLHPQQPNCSDEFWDMAMIHVVGILCFFEHLKMASTSENQA